jgi:hypothetical protein
VSLKLYPEGSPEWLKAVEGIFRFSQAHLRREMICSYGGKIAGYSGYGFTLGVGIRGAIRDMLNNVLKNTKGRIEFPGLRKPNRK